MNILFLIFEAICILGFMICLISFIVYKSGKLGTKSWEETIPVMLSRCFDFCYTEITGKPVPSQIINTALILAQEEVLELVKLFTDTPYLTPALYEFIPNALGIMWVDIRAVNLVAKYKDLQLKDRILMAYHIIQNFYMEKRGTSVNLYIKIATPQRLYFAVALSEEGYQFLEKQRLANEQIEKPSIVDASLEEDVELFVEDDEEENT